MADKISLCGDNCSACPRYTAETEEQLQAAAELWHRVGWRDTVEPAENMRCEGCCAEKKCSYGLLECTQKNDVEECSLCENFPCEKIEDMLLTTERYCKKCKDLCSAEEYEILNKAFFEKEKNLIFSYDSASDENEEAEKNEPAEPADNADNTDNKKNAAAELQKPTDETESAYSLEQTEECDAENESEAEQDLKDSFKILLFAKKAAKHWKLLLIIFGIIVVVGTGIGLFFKYFTVYGGEIYSRGEKHIDLRGSEELDIKGLSRFTDIESIDLREVPVQPEDIDYLSEQMPDCHVLWSVPLSFGNTDSDCTELDFSEATERDFELLAYFTNLQKVDATGSDLYELIKKYREKFTDCEFEWDVEICGQRVSHKASTLSLSQPAAEDLEKLQYLPLLTEVNITGCTEYDVLCRLSQERTECKFLWDVEICGQLYSSETTKIDISGKKIEDVQSLREKLKGLPYLAKLIMCDCGVPDETMAELRDSMPDTEVVWRVYFGIWSMRTDATVFSTRNTDPPEYRLNDKEASVIRYCTKLQLLDLGHNGLTSVEPFKDLTELRVLILADNRLTDISGLEKLTKVEWLELFLNDIEDISVLSNFESLTHVNCSRTLISDPSPLYELENLQYIWMNNCPLTNETKKELRAAQKGCVFDLSIALSATNGRWRENAKYYKMRRAFNGHNGSCTYEW